MFTAFFFARGTIYQPSAEGCQNGLITAKVDTLRTTPILRQKANYGNYGNNKRNTIV